MTKCHRFDNNYYFSFTQKMDKIKQRLEEIRKSIINEEVSYGELVELQSLKAYIDTSDVLLLESAGVPEFN